LKVILPAIDSQSDKDGVQRNEILLNCINVHDSERMGNEGGESAAMFDGKSLRKRGKFRNGEQMT